MSGQAGQKLNAQLKSAVADILAGPYGARAFFSSIYLYINLIRLKYKVKFFLKTVNKKSLLVMIGAAVLGGPLGMASYLMSTKYIGPSYSASISILYPVFAVDRKSVV